MERKALGPLGGLGDMMDQSSCFVQVWPFIPSLVMDEVFFLV